MHIGRVEKRGHQMEYLDNRVLDNRGSTVNKQ